MEIIISGYTGGQPPPVFFYHCIGPDGDSLLATFWEMKNVTRHIVFFANSVMEACRQTNRNFYGCDIQFGDDCKKILKMLRS